MGKASKIKRLLWWSMGRSDSAQSDGAAKSLMSLANRRIPQLIANQPARRPRRKSRWPQGGAGFRAAIDARPSGSVFWPPFGSFGANQTPAHSGRGSGR